uniref:Uncharacterized protein n=1 Tax=Heterorhabditis bacteriophora TaxID=37862 RepID=A0A1I7WLL3_HETBA
MVLMIVTRIGRIYEGTPTLFNSKFRRRKCCGLGFSYLGRLPGISFTFQQDNTTIYTNRSTEIWLEDNDVNVLDCRLNSMENLRQFWCVELMPITVSLKPQSTFNLPFAKHGAK